MTAAPRLKVITPGSDTAEAEDLRQDAVERLLNGLRGEAHWVVIESPTVASGPDVYTLAHVADAAVLVTELPRTRIDQVLDSVEHLDKMGTTVLGTVLLPSPASSGKRSPSAPAESTPRLMPSAQPGAREDDLPSAAVDDWSAARGASSPLHGS
jgi:MinD-like ATPase involved in chromosome partitioning or flagellar assembly